MLVPVWHNGRPYLRCRSCGVTESSLQAYFKIASRDCDHEFEWSNHLYLSKDRSRVVGRCHWCRVPATAIRETQDGAVVYSEILTILQLERSGMGERVEIDVQGPVVTVEGAASQFVPEGEPEVVGMDIEKDCILMTMDTGIPTILVGHTGIAKTMLLRRMHQEKGWPYHTVAGHAQVEVDTLVGKIWVREGSMEFRPGVLPFCMIHGISIGFQEINAVAPEVLIMLHEYLDEGKITITDLPPDHEYFIVRPHENFRLYGTMNPPEYYIGTRELSPALARRCIIRRVEPLGQEDEIDVICSQVVEFDRNLARKIVQVAAGMRKNVGEHKASYFMSTADAVMWARFTQKTQDVHRAAEIAVYGKAPSEDVGLVHDLVTACIGYPP